MIVAIQAKPAAIAHQPARDQSLAPSPETPQTITSEAVVLMVLNQLLVPILPLIHHAPAVLTSLLQAAPLALLIVMPAAPAALI